MLFSKYICTILVLITSTTMANPISKGDKSDKTLNNKIKSGKIIKSESF
jgi:hypothetical protein